MLTREQLVDYRETLHQDFHLEIIDLAIRALDEEVYRENPDTNTRERIILIEALNTLENVRSANLDLIRAYKELDKQSKEMGERFQKLKQKVIDWIMSM